MIYFLENAPAAPQAPVSDTGSMQMLLMIAVALFLMYIIIWRPESKKRKAEEEKRGAMKKGDRVTTFGGEVGTVVKISQETVTIRSGESKIEYMKAAIHDVQPASDEEAKKAEKEEE